MNNIFNSSIKNKEKAIQSLSMTIKQEAPLTTFHNNEMKIYQFSGFSLDYNSYELSSPNGKVCLLATGLFNLLMVFLLRPRRIISRVQLSSQSDCMSPDGKRNIDIAVCRLRHLLGQEGKKLIKTVRKRGYMFTVPVSICRHADITKADFAANPIAEASTFGDVQQYQRYYQALRSMESCKRRRVVRDSARFFNQPAGMLKNLYVRVESLENAVRSYPEVTELRVTRTVAAN